MRTRSIDSLIQPFITAIADGTIEIYNEFSLQHELGAFLRSAMPECKIQFERNVRHFFPDSKIGFIKKEIDVSIFSTDSKQPLYAFELKYPRNGQYPEQMFSFCKDIGFSEQLKLAGFDQTAVLILAEEKPFYQGSGEGIYSYFRHQAPLTGCIQKPTGAKDERIVLSGTYKIHWLPINQGLMYALILI